MQKWNTLSYCWRKWAPYDRLKAQALINSYYSFNLRIKTHSQFTITQLTSPGFTDEYLCSYSRFLNQPSLQTDLYLEWIPQATYNTVYLIKPQ